MVETEFKLRSSVFLPLKTILTGALVPPALVPQGAISLGFQSHREKTGLEIPICIVPS